MKKRWIVLLALVTMLVLVIVGTALASSGGDYEISWWTVDDGGNTLNTGRGYSLGGTAGQPDAGMWGSNGYTLAGGFWSGVRSATPAPPARQFIFLPIVVRNW